MIVANTVRKESGTGIYHVMVRGINKEDIFQTDEYKTTARYFIKIALEECKVRIYAYCFMDNHVHLLIQAKEIEELSNFMYKWECYYAKQYNGWKQRSGYVFQGRFRSEIVETEAYFWACLRYIHLNPVKAEMTKCFWKYPYSSAKEYYAEETIILDRNAMVFFKKKFLDQKNFLGFHTEERIDHFFDIKEEQERVEKIYGEKILKDLMKRKKIQDPQYFLNKLEFRKNLEQEIVKQLKTSRNRAKRIVCELSSTAG